MTIRTRNLLGMALLGWLGLVAPRLAADDAEGSAFVIADGKLTMSAPKGWVRKQPSVRIIEHEFAAPKAEGDDADGRFTVMAAGGSIEANIDRWIGQFSQPDGSSTKEKTRQEQLTVGKNKIQVVDISGSYKDQRGPMTPAVTREDYRMLGAIISTENSGLIFLKFYGPKKTIAANEKGFQEMLKSIKAK
ncbi:MAG: hypothetical protein FJ295_06675 [Planctomycetes bacterium]|nr:hypothetical protein [Planctomycetota bacterium]